MQTSAPSSVLPLGDRIDAGELEDQRILMPPDPLDFEVASRSRIRCVSAFRIVAERDRRQFALIPAGRA